MIGPGEVRQRYLDLVDQLENHYERIQGIPVPNGAGILARDSVLTSFGLDIDNYRRKGLNRFVLPFARNSFLREEMKRYEVKTDAFCDILAPLECCV